MTNTNKINKIENLCLSTEKNPIRKEGDERLNLLKTLFKEVAATTEKIKRGDHIKVYQFHLYYETLYVSFNIPVAFATELTEEEINKLYEEPTLIDNYKDYDFIVINKEEGIQKWCTPGGGHITFHHWESNIVTNIVY
jgi:hypothetical protein